MHCLNDCRHGWPNVRRDFHEQVGQINFQHNYFQIGYERGLLSEVSGVKVAIHKIRIEKKSATESIETDFKAAHVRTNHLLFRKCAKIAKLIVTRRCEWYLVIMACFGWWWCVRV